MHRLVGCHLNGSASLERYFLAILWRYFAVVIPPPTVSFVLPSHHDPVPVSIRCSFCRLDIHVCVSENMLVMLTNQEAEKGIYMQLVVY
jgi:hypothetical protein